MHRFEPERHKTVDNSQHPATPFLLPSTKFVDSVSELVHLQKTHQHLSVPEALNVMGPSSASLGDGDDGECSESSTATAGVGVGVLPG